MRWNTETDEIEHGSWFQGRLYEMRSDLSADGEWMVYLAMGSQGQTWTGICKPPFLRTVVDWENIGTYHGGGVFYERVLRVNAGYAEPKVQLALSKLKMRLPLRIEAAPHSPYSEDEGVLYPRFERDGWIVTRTATKEWWKAHGLQSVETGPQWTLQPSSDQPKLEAVYRGYDQGRVFQFDLAERPDFLGGSVSWACYDSLGQLIVARQGVLERYTLDDLERGLPSFRFDTNDLVPPERHGSPAEREADEASEVAPLGVFEGPTTEVETIALALLHPSREESEALRIAGPDAERAFAESLRSSDPFATNPYFLRHHVLLHVGAHADRVDRLIEEALRLGLRSIALGAALTKGHESYSVQAARRLSANGASIAVVFVAGDPEQAAALRNAINAPQSIE